MPNRFMGLKGKKNLMVVLQGEGPIMVLKKGPP